MFAVQGCSLHPSDRRPADEDPINCWCVKWGVLIPCHCRRGRCRVCLTPSCRILSGRCLCSPLYRSLALGRLERHSRSY